MDRAKSDLERSASKRASQAQTVSAEERHRMIAEAAYYRAERRGFQGGDPVADWLAAEAEIDGRLAKEADAITPSISEERKYW